MEVSLFDDTDSSSSEDTSQSEMESIENSSELARKYSELSVERDQLKKHVVELVVDNEAKAKRINELDGYKTFYDDFGRMFP